MQNSGEDKRCAVTECKRMEEILSESEEKYRNLVENSKDSIVITDLKGNVQFANKATETLTGYTYQNGIRINVRDITPMKLWPKSFAMLLKARSGQAIPYFESMVRRKDGRLIPVESGGQAIFKDGKVVGIQIITRDISGRKKAEYELRKSESKYRTLLENIPQRIFLKDRNSVYMSCNENYAKDLNIKSSKIVGKTDYDFYPKELAEKYRSVDREVMESAKTQDIEEDYVKNGQKMFVHTVKTPVKDENGNVVGILGIFWDITERKKAEATIRESQEKFERLFMSNPEATVFSDVNDRVLNLNPRFSELFGYSPDEAKGQLLDDLIAPDDLKEEAKMLTEITEGYVYHDTVRKRKDGSLIPVSISCASLKCEDRHLGNVVQYKDITERKRMENELKRYSENLAELVEERTRQLEKAQEQLVKSEKLAAIGEIANMVGHDLRNPLQSIENATYFLNQELPKYNIPPKAMEMFHIINSSIDYADKIIRDLQDFSATKPPALEKTDINTIVKDTLSQTQIPKNIELQTELDYFPEIKADKDQIKRVFLNLTQNAIQAMENGGKLAVSTKKTEAFVEVSFKDTGVGIPKENMKKLFTPLYTTKAKGMGMGLAICKKFIENHGGSIEVESQEGKGSTFTAKLPIKQPKGGENR